MRIGVKPGPWGWSFAELVVSWEAAEAAGFDLLSCFDHVTGAPEGRTAWDGPTLLAAMAGRTHRIALGIHVINASLRNPVLLAGQLAVAQAVSGGRLEVGIGAGSYAFARHDHAAIGMPFPRFEERFRGLERCCRLLPALWRGESVSDSGIGAVGVTLGPLGIKLPPIFVGGSSPRALDLAARLADGWHAPGQEEERYGELASRLDDLCRAAGREPIAKSVQLRPGDLDELGDRLHRLAEAGAGTAVVVLDVDQRGAEWVRRIADAAFSR